MGFPRQNVREPDGRLHVDLSKPLWDMKHALLDKYHFSNTLPYECTKEVITMSATDIATSVDVDLDLIYEQTKALPRN
ncbi:MAG: hypothetical protein V8S93_01520 [Lachnospiraceae bacterium]